MIKSLMVSPHTVVFTDLFSSDGFLALGKKQSFLFAEFQLLLTNTTVEFITKLQRSFFFFNGK